MRVKRGIVGRRNHKKVLKLAKGLRGRRKSVFTFAQDAVERSMQFQFVGRKQRKRQFRELWIVRINAACRLAGMSYSKFINGLAKAKIGVDRKILADIAMHDPKAFSAIAEKARAALN